MRILVKNKTVESIYYGEDSAQGWIEIKHIPEPEIREGYIPKMYYRNGIIEYEYSKIEMPKDDSIPYIKTKPSEYEIEEALLFRIKKKQEASIMAEVETLNDEEALAVKALYPTWASFIGKLVTQGKRLYYNDRLYKVRQNHTVLEHQVPSTDTASLYEEVNEKAAGTKEDPIPYNNNMRLELGKFYTQEGVIYMCYRDSEVPVYQDLKELVNIYVNIYE